MTTLPYCHGDVLCVDSIGGHDPLPCCHCSALCVDSAGGHDFTSLLSL